MKSLRLALLTLILTSAVFAAPFGKVVPVGGHVSDIALDNRRSLLYIANFAANRIDVMSTADHELRSPIYVSPQPSAIAVSPGRALPDRGPLRAVDDETTIKPGVTIIDFDANTRRTLALADSPLAIAFGNGDRAFIVTTTNFQLLDPLTGRLRVLANGASLKTEPLPVEFPKFPPEILQASAGVSGDGEIIYVLAQGDQSAAVVMYRVSDEFLRVVGITSAPELGPRVMSVNHSGSLFVAGWALMTPGFIGLAQFPYPTGDFTSAATHSTGPGM
jgi:hypothetical protein